MAAKKKCGSCGKSIPESALSCVFCGARQELTAAAVESEAPREPAEATAAQVAPAAPSATQLEADAAELARRARAVTPEKVPVVRTDEPRRIPSQLGNTLFGLKVLPEELEAAAARVREEEKARAAAKAGAADAPAHSVEPPHAAATGVPSSALATAPHLEPAPEERGDDDGDGDGDDDDDDELDDDRATAIAPAVARVVMALGGVLLIGLYVVSYKIMVALAGAQLFLQHYSLVGGLLLLSGGVMRLPPRVRAALAAAVGAVPLFLVGPTVGGFGGWRGVAAALAFLLLPAALLLRARVSTSQLARGLVAVGVGLTGALYLAPVDGVMPVAAAFALIGSGTLGGLAIGAVFLAPLLLALAALSAFAGRDSTGLGTLWACLVLLLTPGALVVAGLVADESALLHVGVALFAAGASAAVGLSQLLEPPPHAA